MRSIELLAPARTADIGIEAIRHGADAVYIGASGFGARAAASNTVADILRLVDYAHTFRAKVYVTVNTIIYDSEVEDVERMIHQLYEAGVDALIVQDMGLLRMKLPPVPLHASTQMDNRTADKVEWLRRQGFGQVVLARELTYGEIADIHAQCPDVKLEVFVHGALCVSYSGQCYASEACFGRSANRGECAQLCRMEFDLEDSDGRALVRNKRLLSLPDNCRIDSLGELLAAGASSLKIEGRLKDMEYVKNVTAAYRMALDRIIAANPDKYERSSIGVSTFTFTPDVYKSFFRRFHGVHKSLGEYIGTVHEVFTNHFTLSGKSVANGDGMAFVDKDDVLYGFRVNRVDGDRLYPLEMPRRLKRGTKLYRNLDQGFEQLLRKPSAERFIPVDITVDEAKEGFVLTMRDDYGMDVSIEVQCKHELARTPQSDNVCRQLSKLGGTSFRARSTEVAYHSNWFIPSSQLAEWRRTLVAEADKWLGQLQGVALVSSHVDSLQQLQPSVAYKVPQHITYLGNVANQYARQYYKEQGATVIEPAFELSHPGGATVMFCKHCIRRQLGICLKEGGRRQDLFLRMGDGTRFALKFDCRQCIMEVRNSI